MMLSQFDNSTKLLIPFYKSMKQKVEYIYKGKMVFF